MTDNTGLDQGFDQTGSTESDSQTDTTAAGTSTDAQDYDEIITNYKANLTKKQKHIKALNDEAKNNRLRAEAAEKRLAELENTTLEEGSDNKKFSNEDRKKLTEKLKKSIYDEINPKMEAINSENETLRAVSKRMAVNDAILSEASKQKALNPQHVVNLILADESMDIGVEIEGGKLKPYIKDAVDGIDLPSANGRDMNFADLVTKFLADNPYLAQATGKPGAGSSQSMGNPVKGNFTNEQIKKMSPDEFAKNEDAIIRQVKQQGGMT
jgi:hypothetical protein